MRRLLLAALPLFLLGDLARGAVAIDANVSKDQSAASSTIASPPFSTESGQELLLALVSAEYRTGTNTTVKSISGAGLTWTLVVRTNAQSGTSEIWRAFASTALSSVTVTATLSQSVISSMTVMSFSGVNPAGTNGSGAIGAVASASAATGAPTASLVTTANNSLVLGVGEDYSNAIARTIGPGQTLLHQFLDSAGDSYWMQMETSPVAQSGTTVTINDTAPTTDKYNLNICEVLAAPNLSPTWSITGTISPISGGAGATVALSGSSTATVTADQSGNYTFTGLENGSYTVTPTAAGFTFLPQSQPVTINGANQSGINFTAQVVPTWTISGNISPASDGSGATMSLKGPSNATVTADSSGNYNFAGLANGSYTVTPGKSGFSFNPPSASVNVSGANVSGINFTSASAASAIVDVSVSANQSPKSTTVTSPTFSTASGQELLLAFISTDYLKGTNTTVQSVSGAGLTWVLVVRTNAQPGSSEIWRAFAPTSVSNASVTATLSQSVVSSMTVMSFIGADPSGTNGSGGVGAVGSASAASGAPGATLVTTRTDSLVLGVGNDWTNAIARTVGSGQTLVHQYLTPTGDTYWTQMETNPVPQSNTAVTINDSAPTTDQYNLSICEVLAASGAPIVPVPPTVTMTSPAPGTISSLSQVSASVTDNEAITSVQFLLDGAPLGSPLTAPPYSTLWNSSTAANGAHSLSASAQNSAGQTTTSQAMSVTVDNSGNTVVVGSWSSPVTLPAVAVNLILLPTVANSVLFYQDGDTPTVWNYVTNSFVTVPFKPDLFCSGAALMSDGRVFVAGGYDDGGSSIGIANAEIFDPVAKTWKAVPNMSYKRWYPNVTTLSDGTLMVTAGWQATAHSNAGISEIYNPSTNAWTELTNANNPFETYPFLYQLSDGRVLHIGGSEYATDTDVLDIATQTWSVVDSRIIDGASATMYAPGLFVKAGAAADSQMVGSGSNTTFVLDMTQPTPAWQQTPSMAYIRSFVNLTMLPDGTVLATGGETDKNGGTIANAVYAAELWSPQTQTWSTLSSMHTPREYHGTAVLLPDGRVLESGMGADFGNVPNELSAEFFSPPYLFKGARPTITQVPTQIAYGTTFFVGTPDAANISKAVLIRTGAVTHFFDENERYVPLTFTQASGGLTLTAPLNAYLAPPGYYMLFLVNNAGVPSIAPFVQLPTI